MVAVAGESKLEAVGAIGADVLISRQSSDVAGAVRGAVGKVDVIADVVGGAQFGPLLGTIKRCGHYVTADAIGGPIVDFDLRALYLRDLTMHSATVLPPEVFAKLIGCIERGEIRPLVAATFPLEEMSAAQAALMKKEHVGAVVVEVAR